MASVASRSTPRFASIPAKRWLIDPRVAGLRAANTEGLRTLSVTAIPRCENQNLDRPFERFPAGPAGRRAAGDSGPGAANRLSREPRAEPQPQCRYADMPIAAPAAA